MATTLTFNLDRQPPTAGRRLGGGLGVFSYTPTDAHGPSIDTFDLESPTTATAGLADSQSTVTVTVLNGQLMRPSCPDRRRHDP